MPLTVAGFLNEFVSATVLPLDEVLMPLFSRGESSCGVVCCIQLWSQYKRDIDLLE